MPRTQINAKQRVELACYLRTGMKQKEIAKLLKKTSSAISREINKNKSKNGRYRAREAQEKVNKRRKKANSRFKKITGTLRKKIIYRIKKYWSPEQIAGRLNQQSEDQIISYETIYQFIYTQRPDLKKYLRCRKGKYRRKRGTKEREAEREAEKKNRIDTRPVVIEIRARLGDWEGDTVRGSDKKSGLATYTDRKSGYLLAGHVLRALAENVRKTTIELFKKIPKYKRLTCTLDNGVEFSEHELIARSLDLDIYFAYPYHSWERGTNENTNGLLRQFFPKGESLDEVDPEKLKRVVKLINHRPRKRLKYLTPHEVFNKNCVLN